MELGFSGGLEAIREPFDANRAMRAKNETLAELAQEQATTRRKVQPTSNAGLREAMKLNQVFMEKTLQAIDKCRSKGQRRAAQSLEESYDKHWGRRAAFFAQLMSRVHAGIKE